MTTALEVAKLTVARAPQPYVRGGMSYCQQFAGNFWEAHFGRLTPQSYSSAQAACNASTIYTKDWRQASPGDYVYFQYPKYGHVGVYLGSGLMASGTGWSTKAVLDLGKSVYVHRVDDYAAHLPLIGFARTNGARAQITGLTDAWAPQIAPNQRQVKPGSDANIRQGAPTKDAPRVILKAGSIVTPDGYVSSTLPNGQPNGNDKWAKVGDGYLSMTVFTDAGLHDLRDLGVVPAPKPKHVVTINFGPDNVKAVEVVDGEPVLRPGDPERNDFTFGGWAVNGAPYDFATPVTGPLTIDALWTADPNPEPNPGEGQDPTPADPEDPQHPEPEPEIPAEPDPEEEPPVSTPQPTQQSLSAAQLARLVKQAKNAGVEFASDPEQPIIPDNVAKPLWVIFGAIAVSAGPVAILTVLDWANYGPEVATQAASTVGAWVGALAAVLGLSRFAKTKP